MIILRQKFYTQYDESDSLKRMKDSDILAEKKKKQGYSSTATSALGGAALGAGAGTIAAQILKKKGKYGGKIGKAAGLAAAGGAALGAGAELIAKSKKRKENREYNDRLKYAQTQAKRREGADWKSNNTSREGYTY